MQISIDEISITAAEMQISIVEILTRSKPRVSPLQGLFNEHTFKQEENLYVAEGVPHHKVQFIDNEPVLTLLSSKPYGILNLLDEEVRMPQGGDAKWKAKCSERHMNAPIYITKAAGLPATHFMVRHAGESNMPRPLAVVVGPGHRARATWTNRRGCRCATTPATCRTTLAG